MQSRFDKSTDLELLRSLDKGSVDLLLTDPPYLISRKSGMQSHSERKPGDKGYNQVSKRIEDGKEIEVNYGRSFAIARVPYPPMLRPVA